MAYYEPIGGYQVRIDHGGGWQTVYAHLQAEGRVSGQVAMGQPIGRVGSSGSAVTAAHLHWEQKLNGVKQSPLYANGSALNPGPSADQSAPSYTSANCGGGSGAANRASSDIDSNNASDLILTTNEGAAGVKVFAARSTHQGFLAYEQWTPLMGFGWSGVKSMSGDVTGDGKADLVYITAEADGVKAFVMRSTGAGFGSPEYWGWAGFGYNGIKVWLGDVDNNNAADIVITTDEGAAGVKAFVMRSTHQSFLAQEQWTPAMGFGWSGVTSMSADMTGDGKADLVYLTAEPAGTKVFVMRSTGAGFESPVLWSDTDFGYTGIKAWLADVDNNNAADLVLATNEGSGGIKTFVLRSTHQGFLVPEPWSPLIGVGWHGIMPMAGDVTGDDKADLVYITAESVGIKVFVMRSTGSSFGAPEEWSGAGFGYTGIKAWLN